MKFTVTHYLLLKKYKTARKRNSVFKQLKDHLVRRDSSKFGRSFYLDLCDTPERDANTKSDERSDLVCHPRSFVFIVRSAVLSAF